MQAKRTVRSLRWKGPAPGAGAARAGTIGSPAHVGTEAGVTPVQFQWVVRSWLTLPLAQHCDPGGRVQVQWDLGLLAGSAHLLFHVTVQP